MARRGWTWIFCTLLWIVVPVHARADILVVSPHPDDDIITTSGVVQRAIRRGEAVRVVYVTNGDFIGLSIAAIRQAEAVLGQSYLGNPENRLSFLGYPDGSLATIRFNYTAPGSVFVSPHGISSTYASRGLGGTDYHTYRFGSPGLYNWPTMVGDVADIINTSRPTHIFTTSQWDTHSDHGTTYHIVHEALLQVMATAPGYNPTIHKTSVWPGDPAWPLPSDGSTYFTPFVHVGIDDPTELVWSERESLDVPSSMQVTFSPTNAKYLAISAHDSQGGMGRYIGQWVHKDEFFWTEQLAGTNRPPVPNAGLDQTVGEGVLVTLDGSASWDRNGGLVTHQWRQVAGPAVTLSSLAATRPTFTAPTGLAADTILEFELTVSDGALSSVPDAVRVIVRSSLPPPTWGPNVAPLATVSASTQRSGSGQGAVKAVDGFIDGYPGDATREWVTDAEGVGAWIQMNWSTPVTIGRIVLYDRPNPADQILGGVVEFSDGSTLPVGPLVNTAGPTEYIFPSRTVSSLRLTVTQVSSGTANVGLAEFEVFEIGGINRAPVANAGPDQVVSGGQTVVLNGTGSSDPNGDPLTFLWSQVSGPPVSLSSTSSATPIFVAPAALPGAQALRFSLVVRDATFTSPADIVDIVIPGTVNAAPIAQAGPDVVASAGATVMLDGSTSADPEGAPITYQWTQIAGPAVTLSSSTVARPTFTIPSATPDSVLTFRLIVNDGARASAPDTVSVTVVALPGPTSNIAPIAAVAASSDRAPTQSALKAVDGFVDGYPGDSSREWATAGESTGAWIELTWPVAHLVARVRLHDRPNNDDHIRAGTLTFSDGSSVAVGTLNNDGTATDLVFAPRMVRWLRFTVTTTSPSTSNVGLAEFFVFEQAGASTNQPPIAVAGPAQTVPGGSAVLLDGRGSSDPEGSTLTFAWSQVSGPSATLTGANTATPSFTAPPATRLAQLMRFQLTVGDGTQTSGDTTDVTIAALPNTAPVANAGPDQLVNGGATVQLDGRGSVDPELDPLTFHWTQVAGPAVTLTAPTTSTPSFAAPAADTHAQVIVFELMVSDGILSSPVDSVMVTINAQPNPANIAVIAAVTASAENGPMQPALKAIDQIVSGFPAMPATEWVAPAGGAGSWIQLDWPGDRVINVVRLYDRVNADDQITGGTLLFSDGSSTTFGALPNTGGAGLEITFTPKTVRWVRMRVDTVGPRTNSIGLAEIEVFEGTVAPPTIAIGDVTVMEGSAPNLMAVFTVTLSRTSAQSVTVNYATANGTAVAVQDFTAVSGTLSFAPGVASQTVSVPILDDTTNEATETFTVNLTAPVNATIADAQGVGSIVENDPVPTLTVTGLALPEGNTGSSNAIFTVSLSAASGRTVTVSYVTANGTATAPLDYTATSGTLTFAPGTTSQTVAVVVFGDTLDEANETLFIDLSAPSNATVAVGRGTATISDDDTAPSISVGDATLTEGDSGTANMTFTVSLSTASGQTVTVNYATANGTATTPQDYTAQSGTLTFAPGSMTRTFTVPVVGDLFDEVNETFVVNLTAPVSATLADAQGVGTITDNDGTPSLAIGDVSVAETNTGTNVNAVFTVALNAASGQTVTVNYATANGTAASPADYTAGSGTLTFAPGTTTQTVTVPVIGDVLDEANETFVVNLSGAVNATIADTQATATITDNDAAPTLAMGDVTVTETNTGTNVNAVFAVTLSAVSGQIVTVAYATANGTATAPADYTAGSGTLTFAAGTTSQTITVPVVGDALDEANETFVINFTNPVNVTTPDTQAVGTITDNDTAPSLSIADVTVTETNTGTNVNAVFTATLSAASGQTVTVNYATANGTATVPADYTAASGTLTFAAGTTSQTITVPVIGDAIDETNEAFVVNLSAATNATIADTQATGTITDNDSAPTIAVSDIGVTEANIGTNVSAVFTVTLSNPSASTVTVNYATANGTAAAPADYTAGSGTLTFAAGTTSQTVTVPVIGDNIDEANETFVVNLSAATNATIADAQAIATITDNDATPTLAIGDVAVTETNTGSNVNAVFTVTLSAVSGQTVTVAYATANGTATAPADYTTGSGTLTFAPGATSQTITVPVIGDNLDEANETFVVNLSNPVNATAPDTQATGTINDNDATPSISISDASVTEGNTGSVTVNVTVSLSAPSGQTVTVNIASANGTATDGQDYVGGSGPLTFAPGTTSLTIPGTILGDLLDEANETILVNLSAPVNATIADAQGVITIVDNDPTPTLSINSVSVTEPDSGSVNLVFTVTLSAASGRAVTVNYATANGTASQPSDYASRSGTLTFNAGVTTMTITVPVNGDNTRESNETFVVNLSGATNATIATAQATGTILNDD